MGGMLTICKGGDTNGLSSMYGALEEAYGANGGKGEGPMNDKEFVELLCKRIAETDSKYKDDFEAGEPVAEATSLTVAAFKRWATRTARCNPLWRVAEAEVEHPLTIDDFQAALSKDPQLQFTGRILLAKKLVDFDSDLLGLHMKSRKNWIPWEESATKDYFWEILRDAGKENETPKSLELSDIRRFCESDGILLRSIDYAFGYTEWDGSQDCLVTPKKEQFVTIPLSDVQKGFEGSGAYTELGVLLLAYQRAIAPPGKLKEEVEKGDRYYFDQEPGSGSGDKNDKGGSGDKENSAYPSLKPVVCIRRHVTFVGGSDEFINEPEQPSAIAEDANGHLNVPADAAAPAVAPAAANGGQPPAPPAAATDAAAAAGDGDGDAAAPAPADEPSKSNSMYPKLGKK